MVIHMADEWVRTEYTLSEAVRSPPFGPHYMLRCQHIPKTFFYVVGRIRAPRVQHVNLFIQIRTGILPLDYSTAFQLHPSKSLYGCCTLHYPVQCGTHHANDVNPNLLY